MRHYEFEINLFVDGELAGESRKELFEHLSECSECQNTFSQFLQIKEKSRTFCSDNLNQIKNKPKQSTKLYKIGFYTSAATAVFLLFFLVSQKPKETLITKNQVRVDTVFVQKENSNTQFQKTNANSITPGMKELPKESSQKAYLHYVMNLRTEKFTEADKLKLDYGSIQ